MAKKKTAIEEFNEFMKSGKSPGSVEDFPFFQKLVERLIEENKPKPDDPNSKSPCSSCIGAQCGCNIMHKRTPKTECNSYAKVGSVVITYK
jgi:hypothetical protein